MAIEYLRELESYFKRPGMVEPDDLTTAKITEFYHINPRQDILAKMEQVEV